MRQRSVLLSLVFSIFATGALACGADDGSSPEAAGSDGEPRPSGGGGGSATCSLELTRAGTIAGTSLDYPSAPDTTWFNTSLEEEALNELDEAMMREAGLSPEDDEDVRRFAYFTRGFDFRWIVREDPSPGNWFGKSDFGVYLFDVVDTGTPPDAAIAVFDASSVRDARLSGDKGRLGDAIRTTVDAMRADRRPKAIVAFAPDRNPESSWERAFINLFARDVHFATTGSVSTSNLRDAAGRPVSGVTYPLRDVSTLDAAAEGEMAGAPFTVRGACLALRISG
jgi:hypothetical protein